MNLTYVTSYRGREIQRKIMAITAFARCLTLADFLRHIAPYLQIRYAKGWCGLIPI
jgi:hypothetical protein